MLDTPMHRASLVAHLVILMIVLVTGADALASSITVAPVKINSPDVLALANLRYNEWMVGEESPPSVDAFRAATAEIMAERISQGAAAFLARSDGSPAGAIEVSPIEFHGLGSAAEHFLYATDLVTSKEHRRKGVGNALMVAIEDHAIQKGASHLFLHVEQENTAARMFYERESLGYSEPSVDLQLDIDRLATNAGAVGQTLLCKTLPMKRSLAGGGFGGGAVKKKTGKKKRSK